MGQLPGLGQEVLVCMRLVEIEVSLFPHGLSLVILVPDHGLHGVTSLTKHEMESYQNSPTLLPWCIREIRDHML